MDFKKGVVSMQIPGDPYPIEVPDIFDVLDWLFG